MIESKFTEVFALEDQFFFGLEGYFDEILTQDDFDSIDWPVKFFNCELRKALLTAENYDSFLSYYYGNNQASGMNDAIQTMTTNDRAALVSREIDPMDCYYRCLKAHEVKRAMAFKDDYIVLGTVKEQVKQCGNAVTPPVMKWLSGQVAKVL